MTATLNGRLCSTVRATLPRYGVGSVWATLATADAVATTPGGARLEVAGLVLVGTVKRQGERSGLRSVEIELGYGGWSRPVPATGKGGGLIAGNLVRLEAVASSIALAAGERVSLAAGVDRKLGETVAARLGQVDAGALLSQACASPAGATVVPWWVDVDGTTRLGARTGAAVTAKAVDVDDLARAYSYAEDDALQLLPGATIDGSPIVELRIEASGTEVREVATVAVGEEEPHTFAALMRRLILRVIGPHVSARTIYRYVVREVVDGRIRATPVRSLLAPTLEGLRVWPGIAGARCTPKEGSEILVQFADGDPVASAACVVGFSPADIGTLAIPEQVEIDGDEVVLAQGTRAVARVNDTVNVGALSFSGVANTMIITYTPPTGAATVWTLTSTIAAGAIVHAITGSGPLSGVITSGRNEVKA
jgi:hypothetical protein